jgi:hypothetical protein
MGSVEFSFSLLCILPEVMVANMTCMSHGKSWLTILTFRDDTLTIVMGIIEYTLE